MLWTYTEAANRAHTKNHESWEPWDSSPRNVEALGHWLRSPLGDMGQIALPHNQVAHDVLKRLHADLSHDVMDLSVEEMDFEATATIRMVRTSDNRYFELELWWSVD